MGKREIESINKRFARCFPDLPLTFEKPGARIRMENYIPCAKIFKGYKLG